MQSLASRYATPMMTGLFAVSLISGVLLFFHLGPGAVHGMHEWLSMVLILAFALHLWKNWRPMVVYFRKAPMALSLALSVLAAALFFLPSAGGAEGGPPQFQLARRMMTATPAEIAPVLGVTEAGLVRDLADHGMKVIPGQTLRETAAAAGKTEADLAAALVALQP